MEKTYNDTKKNLERLVDSYVTSWKVNFEENVCRNLWNKKENFFIVKRKRNFYKILKEVNDE